MLAGAPLDGLRVVRVHAELGGDRVRGGRIGVRLDLLHAHDVGIERAKLTDRERHPAIERSFGAPEVERDDAQVHAGSHGLWIVDVDVDVDVDLNLNLNATVDLIVDVCL